MASSRNSPPADGSPPRPATRMAVTPPSAQKRPTRRRRHRAMRRQSSRSTPRWPRHWRHTARRVSASPSRSPAASIRWCCSTRCMRWPRVSRSRLSAIHVHHGCRRTPTAGPSSAPQQCAPRGVPLTIAPSRCRAPCRRRASKRRARTRATTNSLGADADVVALAHHADDQAETVLLQLLRGAGPPGLAAMPRHRAGDAAGPALLRPLLDLPRATLAAYANARGLAWIDDESNADRRHQAQPAAARRRAAAWPRRFPAIRRRSCARRPPGRGSALARRARRAGRRRHVEDGLDRATLDRAVARPRPQPAALVPARRGAARRRPPRGSPRCLRSCRRRRRRARAHRPRRRRNRHAIADASSCTRRPPAPFARGWRGETSVELPGGILRFERTRGDGLAAAKFDAAAVTLRSRVGGERIQLAANRPRRAVKKLLQDAQLPIWRREALPLVWCGDELAAVPGIGVALAFQARSDEDGMARRLAPEREPRRTARRAVSNRPPGVGRRRAHGAARQARLTSRRDQGLNARRAQKTPCTVGLFLWRFR